MRLNSSSNVNLQYHSVGLILTLIGLKEILAHMSLIPIRNSQIHDNTPDTNTCKFFQFPVGNSKCVESFMFNNDAPMFNFYQKSLNSCCFSSLVPDFASIKLTKAANDISLRIE